jgi:hypothetical protein
MTIPCKFERSVLSHDEHEIILRSHHPGIYDVLLEDLKALRQRLRDMRNRERTLAREKRREVRGKGEPRGRSFAGTAEYLCSANKCFAGALSGAPCSARLWPIWITRGRAHLRGK